MTVAVFDWAVWSARYPELVAKGVTEPLAASLFIEAGLLLSNGPCSVVQDIPTRTLLLYMIVAHLAALSPVVRGGDGSAVGRTSSATEGSVSLSLDYAVTGAQAAYWAQTQYGAQFWASTARFRTFSYIPGPQRYLGTAAFPFGFRQ